MSDDIQKINEATRSLSGKILDVVQRAQVAIPGIVTNPTGFFLKKQDPQCPFIIRLSGGENENGQKLAGLLYTTIKETLPNTKLYMYAKEPYLTPALMIDQQDVAALPYDSVVALNHKLGSLSALARDEIKDQVQTFNISRLHAEERQIDIDIHKNVVGLFHDINHFIARSGFVCCSDVDYWNVGKDGYAALMFRSLKEDCFDVVGTIASKIEAIGSVRLLPDSGPCTQCNIILKTSDLGASATTRLLDIRRNLRSEIRKSPENIRAEIADFTIELNEHLKSGEPLIHNYRSLGL